MCGPANINYLAKSPIAYVATPYDDHFITVPDHLSGVFFTKAAFKKMSALNFHMQTVVNPILKGTILGAAIGTTVGATVGMVTAGPPGAAVGAVKGVIVGAIFGAVGGVLYIYVPKNDFKAWKDREAQTEVMKIFVDLHNEDKELENYVCPITQSPYENPVKDPFGNTYERTAIVKWINENKNPNGFATDPKRNGLVCINQLEPDYVMLIKMQCAYMRILTRESAQNNIHPSIKEGLQLARDNIDKKVANYLENHTCDLLKQMRNGRLTAIEYANKMNELMKTVQP